MRNGSSLEMNMTPKASIGLPASSASRSVSQPPTPRSLKSGTFAMTTSVPIADALSRRHRLRPSSIDSLMCGARSAGIGSRRSARGAA
jgi:hypothetical protein